MSVVIKCADNRFIKQTTAVKELGGLTGVFDMAEGGIERDTACDTGDKENMCH